MKKILLLVLIGLISEFAAAQRFGGGFLAGLSMSQLDGDSFGGFNKAGIAAGIFTTTKINKKLDLQMELRYVQKGSQSDSKDPEVFYKSKLNYIELPLFLKYTIYPKLTADLGIAIGYLQKSTEDKDGYGDLPADPSFKKIEFSGLAGLEYQLWKQLSVNIRYNYSILPVRDHPGEQTWYLNKGQYNSVLTVTIYYQLADFRE
ncbi:MAG: porin family protein [Bacteroidales bacterium]|jgi:opacity protein-like surface antigen|nr:porin family protein [Bacteroidales bacterium]